MTPTQRLRERIIDFMAGMGWNVERLDLDVEQKAGLDCAMFRLEVSGYEVPDE